LSQSDIVAYDRGKVDYVSTKAEYYEQVDLRNGHAAKCKEGFEIVDVDRTRVRDIMTPVVYSVKPDTPAYNVIEDMLGRKVHRLFVVDNDDVLVGVVSAFDVLRHLCPE
jgi:CBS domain-containing protein